MLIQEWMKFPHIEKGYRTGVTNYKHALFSLFSIHNESVNAWTMITSNFIACGLFFYTVKYINTDLTPFIIFFLASCIHLPFSVGYHLFLPISEKTRDFWRKLDITFIFISGTLFAFAFGYFVFDIHILLFFILIGVCLTCKYISLQTFNRTQITKLIGLIVLLYLFPMFFKAIRDMDLTAFIYGISVTILLTISALCYATSWPECSYTGTYDIIGNSHNILHMGIMIAYILEYMFILHCMP